MQWKRKNSGWIEKNGNSELEDINEVNNSVTILKQIKMIQCLKFETFSCGMIRGVKLFFFFLTLYIVQLLK
jgi:hypothetical protein